MNFPPDEKYLKFVNKLVERDDLRLTNGNCGIFAYALKEVFKSGTLFNVGGFHHILLQYNNKFYDGESIYESLEDLKNSRWGEYFDPDGGELIDNDETYDTIKNHTAYSGCKDDFIKIIRDEFK